MGAVTRRMLPGIEQGNDDTPCGIATAPEAGPGPGEELPSSPRRQSSWKVITERCRPVRATSSELRPAGVRDRWEAVSRQRTANPTLAIGWMWILGYCDNEEASPPEGTDLAGTNPPLAEARLFSSPGPPGGSPAAPAARCEARAPTIVAPCGRCPPDRRPGHYQALPKAPRGCGTPGC